MDFDRDELLKMIARNLDVPETIIKPESTFKEDLGADSLSLVELVMAIEEKLNISVPDEDAEKFIRVQDVIAYLERIKL
jgi:acyl carrier protein